MKQHLLFLITLHLNTPYHALFIISSLSSFFFFVLTIILFPPCMFLVTVAGKAGINLFSRRSRVLNKVKVGYKGASFKPNKTKGRLRMEGTTGETLHLTKYSSKSQDCTQGYRICPKIKGKYGFK